LIKVEFKVQTLQITHKYSSRGKRLRLNDDDYFVQEGCDWMLSFASGEVTLAHLSKRYPFLAAEISKQGLQITAAQVFKGLHAVWLS